MSTLVIVGISVSGAFVYASIGGIVGAIGMACAGHDKQYRKCYDVGWAVGIFWPVTAFALVGVALGRRVLKRIDEPKPARLPKATAGGRD